MKSLIAFVTLLAFPCSLFAQETNFSGYFETQLSFASINGAYEQLNSNKLRVDVEGKPSDKVAFGANFDYITYHGKTEYNLLDFLPKSVSAVVGDALRDMYVMAYENRNFLDNAYLKISFKYADVTLGKQQISLGTGYAWNPTDVFNFKDQFDPTYEQPGHNAIRLDIPIGDNYEVMAIYTPGERWCDAGKLLRFKGKIPRFDYSFIAVERMWTFTDFLTFQPLEQKRRLFGGDLAGELFGLGTWAEVAYNSMDKTKNYWDIAAGLDYTFDSGTYVMGEYYRNNLGKTNSDEYDLTDWMRLISAETKALSRDQIYLFVSYPATDLITVGNSVIFSISDQSIAIVPNIVYSIFEDVELTVFGNFYTGKEGTAYASNLGNGGIFRARVYF